MQKRGAYVLLAVLFVTGLGFLVFSKEELTTIEPGDVGESVVFVDSAALVLLAREKYMDLYTAGGDTLRCNVALWRGVYADQEFVQLLRADPTVVVQTAAQLPNDVLGLSNNKVTIAPEARIKALNERAFIALFIGGIVCVLSLAGLVATFLKK